MRRLREYSFGRPTVPRDETSVELFEDVALAFAPPPLGRDDGGRRRLSRGDTLVRAPSMSPPSAPQTAPAAVVGYPADRYPVASVVTVVPPRAQYVDPELGRAFHPPPRGDDPTNARWSFSRDPDDPRAYGFAPAFAEKDVRRGFVRRVFALVASMLLVALAVAAVFLFVPEVNAWIAANPWTVWVAFFGLFGAMFALTCSPTLRPRAPHNYLLLAAFTVLLSFFVAVVVAAFDARTVLVAVAVVSVLVVALVLFAAQTAVDFTTMHAMLFTLLVGLIVMGILGVWFASDFIRIVYATLGAVIFSAYLVADVQTIMGGKTYRIGPDEHVFAAVVVFLDVMNLFLMVLNLVGFARE